MSMAEPRRRKKWSLNPRGTLWANDDNKFGQKLMEKMGWSKGSGLGREQQGIKEHLSVRFKDDNKGIGFTGSDDEWIKHYEGFENVLASLNSQENNAVSSNGDGQSDNSSVAKTSLESSSKASKARVHYHKFTRGKDLSRLSEDDLGCILGSKRAKRLAEVKATEEDVTQPEDAVGTVEHSMGVTTIKACSIQEYFAQKMEALRNGIRCQQPQSQAEEEDMCEETVERPGFGFSDAGNDTSNVPAAEEGVGKKKKKKKQVEPGDTNIAESEEVLKNGIEETENIPRKKKKKKHVKLDDTEVTESEGKSENCIEETENIASKKKKKKQMKLEDDNVAENGEKSENCMEDSENIPSKKKKKKKKKKQIKLEDVNVDENEEKSENCKEDSENIPSKKKKKKTKQGFHTSAVNGFVESEEVHVAGSEEKPKNHIETTENPPNKKRKKRKGKDMTGANNGIVCEDTEKLIHTSSENGHSTSITNGEPEKKKKKKHINTIEDTGKSSVPIEDGTKIKKKKRKHIDISEECVVSHSEVQDQEVKKKKKKKEK